MNLMFSRSSLPCFHPYNSISAGKIRRRLTVAVRGLTPTTLDDTKQKIRLYFFFLACWPKGNVFSVLV